MDLDDVSMDLDMNEDDELEFHNEIVTKIQARARGMLGRMRIRRMINERFEKIRDPRRNEYFYYDKVNDTSSWLKPSLLKGDEDILEIAPTYTENEAAEMITTLWRQLCGLRRVQRLYATTVEKCKVDDGWGEGRMVKAYKKKDRPSNWMRQSGLEPLQPKLKDGLREITSSRASNRPLSSPEKEKPPTAASKDGGIRESKSRTSERSALSKEEAGSKSSSRPTTPGYEAETFYELPKFMEGTLKHPYPDESDVESSSDEDEDEDEGDDDESELDSDEERERRIANRKLPRSRAQMILDNVEDNIGGDKGANVHNKYLKLSNFGIPHLSSRVYEMTTLMDLDLSGNKLRRVSLEIRNLLVLKKLNLYDNEISFIPREIEDLKKMEVMILGKNRLQEVPGHLFKLNKMTHFDVSHNLFSPRAPVESGNMELLKDLKEWDITIGRYSKLEIYTLDNNGIEEWPIQLERCESLTTLNIASNKVKDIPQLIAQNSSLTHLNVSHNLLVNLPPAIYFLRRLKELHCASNQITKFVTTSLNEFEELVFVNISRNALKSLEQELTAFVRVESLIANGNQISSISESVSAMSCLTHLDLSENKLDALPDALAECTTLTKLELCRNEFKHFPSCISSLSILTYLSMDHCYISEDAPDEYFSLLMELTYLDLSHNKIVNLPQSIYSLSKLQTLHLQRNVIINLDAEMKGLLALEYLDMRDNDIDEIPNTIDECTNLTYLDISFNAILDQGFPMELGELRKLRKLYVEHNELTMHPPFQFSTTLKSLSLNGNPIKESSWNKNTDDLDEKNVEGDENGGITLNRIKDALLAAVSTNEKIRIIPPDEFEEKEYPDIDKKELRGKSAAEKKELKRLHASKIQDLKDIAKKKRDLTSDSLKWYARLSLYFKETIARDITNIWDSKVQIYSLHRIKSKNLPLYDDLLRQYVPNLNLHAPYEYSPDEQKLLYLSIDCEVQEAIESFEQCAHLIHRYAQLNELSKEFVPSTIEHDEKYSMRHSVAALSQASKVKLNNMVSKKHHTSLKPGERVPEKSHGDRVSDHIQEGYYVSQKVPPSDGKRTLETVGESEDGIVKSSGGVHTEEENDVKDATENLDGVDIDAVNAAVLSEGIAHLYRIIFTNYNPSSSYLSGMSSKNRPGKPTTNFAYEIKTKNTERFDEKQELMNGREGVPNNPQQDKQKGSKFRDSHRGKKASVKNNINMSVKSKSTKQGNVGNHHWFMTLTFEDNDGNIIHPMQRSCTKDNQGETTIFGEEEDYMDIQICGNKHQFIKNHVSIEVFEHKTMRDISFGKCQISLQSFLVSLEEEQELVPSNIELLDEKGKVVGTLQIFGMITRRNEVDLTMHQLESGGLLTVEKIIATELSNADLLGKNDPIIYFRYGDQKDTQKTKPIMDAGEIAIWDEEAERIDVDFEVSKTQLMEEPLHIEVYDYNVTGDTLIGTGSINSCKNLLASMGETKEMDLCTLMDTKDRVQGHVKLFMSLHDRRAILSTVMVDRHTIDKIPLENGGIITISTVHLQSPSNDGNQERYVTFSYKDLPMQYTEKKSSRRSRITWDDRDFTDMEFDVKKNQVDYEYCTIEAYNYSTLGKDELIGKVEVSLVGLMLNMGSIFESPVLQLRDSYGDPTGHDVKFEAKLISKPKQLDVENRDENSLSYVDMPDGGLLFVRRVYVKELRNVEGSLFGGGKNDPFVEFTLGNDHHYQRTSVMQDAGRQALWELSDGLDVEMLVTKDDLVNNKLKMEVFDYNDATFNKSIGSCEVSLHNLLLRIDIDETLPLLELRDSKGRRAGVIKVDLTLLHRPPEHSLEVDDIKKNMIKDFRIPSGSAVLTVHEIMCRELKNVEFFGNNDPFVQFKFGDRRIQKTPVKHDAGSKAVWSEADPCQSMLDIEFTVTRNELVRDTMTIEVYDWSASHNKLIGSVNLSMRTLILYLNAEDLQELPFLEIKDNKGKRAGLIKLFLSLMECPAVIPPLTDVDKQGLYNAELDRGGIITVEKIVCRELKNVELFGKNDPFVTLTMSHMPNKSYKTEYKDNAGVKAVWDNEDEHPLDIELELTQSELINETMKIEVFDYSISHNTLIGRTEVSLATTLLCIGQKCNTPTVDLLDSRGEKAGTIKISMTLRPRPTRLFFGPIEDQAKFLKKLKYTDGGNVTIRKIEAHGMQDVETFGKNDVYILMKYGDESFRSFTQHDTGDHASWDYLNWKFLNLTRDEILMHTLTIQVWEENELTSDVMIGQTEGIVPNLFLNIGVEHEIHEEPIYADIIKKKQGKNSGRLRIFLQLNDKPPKIKKKLAPIDNSTVPRILFYPETGPCFEEFAFLAYQCYITLASLVFQRVETILKTIRMIEKDNALNPSCLPLVFRSDDDMCDLFADEYDALRPRVEPQKSKGKTIKSKKDVMAELFGSSKAAEGDVLSDDKKNSNKRDKSNGSKNEETPKLDVNKPYDKLSFDEDTQITVPHPDAQAVVKYLWEYVRHSIVWSYVLFSAANDLMVRWGWDTGTPDFKKRGTLLIHPSVKGLRAESSRLNFSFAKLQQYLGKYTHATITYDKMLVFFSLSNYTMYRKILVEKIKCYLAQGEYYAAYELSELLALKDLPKSMHRCIYDLTDVNIINILKTNRAVGLFLMISNAMVTRLEGRHTHWELNPRVGFGYKNAEQQRMYNLDSRGVLHRGSPSKQCRELDIMYNLDSLNAGEVAAEMKRKKKEEDEEIAKSKKEIYDFVHMHKSRAQAALEQSYLDVPPKLTPEQQMMQDAM